MMKSGYELLSFLVKKKKTGKLNNIFRFSLSKK